MMINLIFVLTLFFSLMNFTSCSSDTVNELKIKGAVEIQRVVERELTKSYSEVSIANHDCSKEATAIGEKVYSKTASFLKIREVENSANLIGSSLLIPVCKLIGEKYLPGLIINSPGADYRCLKFIGSEGIKKISNHLCSLISV